MVSLGPEDFESPSPDYPSRRGVLISVIVMTVFAAVMGYLALTQTPEQAAAKAAAERLRIERCDPGAVRYEHAQKRCDPVLDAMGHGR